MIYIDSVGHLVSDNSEEELHKFAFSIGLKRKWYQRKRLPHYDCTTDRMIQTAQIFGAILVTSKEIVNIIKSTQNQKFLDLDPNGVRIYS